MKSLLRWLAWGGAGVAVAAVLLAAGVLVASELEIQKRWPDTGSPVRAAIGPAAVARGERLATLYGCKDCHHADLRGGIFFDHPEVARLWAANLTLDAAEDTDADLTRAIRTGVADDGRPLIGMPSEAFSRLSDAEVADILAFVRSKPKGGNRQPGPAVGPIGRMGVLMRQYMSAPRAVAGARGRPIPSYGPGFEAGREVVRACVECHGVDLHGDKMVGSPDLMIAASYSLPDFERLLRTGVASQGRRLGLMSEAAPGRFNVLTHEQIAALHAYLTERAVRAP
jgi:mono/diheme cytochrome c family protein